MTGPDAPVLRVVRGHATAGEVAAVTTVLMALAARRRQARAAAQAPGGLPARRSAWCDRSALMPEPVIPGPGGWRASAFPGR